MSIPSAAPQFARMPASRSSSRIIAPCTAATAHGLRWPASDDGRLLPHWCSPLFFLATAGVERTYCYIVRRIAAISSTRLPCPIRQSGNAEEGTNAPQPYHLHMRRGLHFLLVVILVLRGLAGTAMAAGVLPPLMPTGPQHAQEHVREHVQHDVHVMRGDSETAASARDSKSTVPSHPHSGHHASVDPTGAECGECTADAHAHDHHSTVCSACEICHSAMLDVAAPAIPTPPLKGSTQPIASVQFASAPAALAVKPPIA